MLSVALTTPEPVDRAPGFCTCKTRNMGFFLALAGLLCRKLVSSTAAASLLATPNFARHNAVHAQDKLY